MHHASLPAAANWALIMLCVGGAVVAAVGLLGSRPAAGRLDRYGGRSSELFHLIMLAAMTVMASEWSGSLSATRWRQLFGALAIASAVWLIAETRGRSSDRGDRIGAAGYHCVAALAMVYATLGSAAASTGHAHHAATGHPVDSPYPVLGWFLAGVFLLDAVVAAAAVVRPPGGVESTTRRRVVTVFPHLTMDIAMTMMLVAGLTSF
ncbi:DUF5134 domain-containing protein [Nocardia barduliensis]|uniref:DUF5134 domain-containing protein n=1 Tax=Nocardia barduliensis TaxID=2736643 RepID=UPI0015728CF5|nr:DUF5134 domain-containing protein [Nocardia barduliensis]